MNLVSILIICILFIMGVLFIVWGISFKYTTNRLVNKCTSQCKGILVKLKEIKIYHSDSDSKRWYPIKSDVPIYEYEVQGKKYTIKGTNGHGFKIGDVVQINYNPENPSECYIDGYSFKLWIVLLIFGIIFIIMTLLFYFLIKFIF